MSTARSPLAGSLSGSLNPKSLEENVKGVSSAIDKVRSAATGGALIVSGRLMVEVTVPEVSA